jgi:hypothetical protein
VALRHDVDYSLDLAIECAAIEREMNCRSTFYVLPTAEYWQEPNLVEKCLELQGLGHEVGLHINVVTEWMEGRTDDVAGRLGESLRMLRSAGVTITGCAAHGDQACYRKQFSNYWVFQELRPDDPAETETGLSAEGIAPCDPTRSVTYPASGVLTRDDGRRLALWSVSLAELGLDYHAMHVPFDRYYTDSGGRWKRSPDPLKEDLAGLRVQVLMHPIHWRGSRRSVFFLSTARSGSTWLAQRVETATTTCGRHELSLNHRYLEQELQVEKHTDFDVDLFLSDRDYVRSLLHDTKAWRDTLRTDYAEANVYLEQFIPEVLDAFPEAQIIHLQRDLKRVVASLRSRDWYDTPWDRKHYRPPVDDWPLMTPFERACWYVRDVNERLMQATDKRVRLEDVSPSAEAMGRTLRSLGFCVISQLLAKGHDERLNVSRGEALPDARRWGACRQAVFHSICGRTQQAMGYSRPGWLMRCLAKIARQWPAARHALFEGLARAFELPPLPVVSVDASTVGRLSVNAGGCAVTCHPDEMSVNCFGGVHAHVVLGGGVWDRARGGEGWPARRWNLYRGTSHVQVFGPGLVELRCLHYDHTGQLVGSRRLGRHSTCRDRTEFAFSLPRGVRRFKLALYANCHAMPERFSFYGLAVVRQSLPGVWLDAVRPRARSASGDYPPPDRREP